MYEGICEMCGMRFYYERGKKVTCSVKCRKKLNYRNYKEKEEKKNRPANYYLGQDAKEAKELGLSYGQYMAYKVGKLRIEKSEAANE